MPSLPQFELADFIIKVVQQLGFPIFVAVWLLVQGNRQHATNVAVLRAMETQLVELSTTIKILVEFVRESTIHLPRSHD